MQNELYLGAHCSASGGLHKAIERVVALDGTALQIFTRNQRQCNPAPLSQEETKAFAHAWQTWGNHPVLSHGSYLINLASPEKSQLQRSIQALAHELERCTLLGIPYLVLHPGSHKGQGTEAGIRTCAAALDQAMEKALDHYGQSKSVQVLLETTAGQGTGLGSSFEELARIIECSLYPERIAICLDTGHVFAAGYDLRSPEKYARSIDSLEEIIGLERLKAIHLNDSKTSLGSRVDRHEHIGKGQLGLEAFSLLMQDDRLSRMPMLIETPKDKDCKWDRQNLELLKKLRQKSDTR